MPRAGGRKGHGRTKAFIARRPTPGADDLPGGETDDVYDLPDDEAGGDRAESGEGADDTNDRPGEAGANDTDDRMS